MVDFFSVLDWIAALLFGGALGMTALGTKELNAARLMIWAALVISILRWTMWAFASDQPWYVRALVGGALGAFLLAAIPAALHWIAAKQPAVSPNESQSAPAPTPPPTTTSPPADFHPGTIAHIRSYANGGGAIRIEGDLSKNDSR